MSRPPLPPSASQFAPTPRFSLAKPKPAAQQHDAAPSPPRSTLAHALRPPPLSEDVEDAASSYNNEEDEEMLLTTEPGEVVQPSIEHGYEHLQEHEQQYPTTELPYSPKRRRIHSDLASPQRTAVGNTTTSHPRFALGSHVNASSASMPAPLSRPAFLRPPTPPAAAPIPQTFSPHRKGANLISGGTASTVQAWVIAAGQSAAQNWRQQATYQYSQVQGEGWGFRVRVEMAEEMEGGGWRVLGRKDDGSDETVRCLLVGEGKGEVSAGVSVGVRGLGWEVGIDGQGQWWIGVGWEAG